MSATADEAVTGITFESIRSRLPAPPLRRRTPHHLVLDVTHRAGELCECLQWKGEVAAGLKELDDKEREQARVAAGRLLVSLVSLAARCRIDLPRAIKAKIKLNEMKYPVDLVKGRAGKYTEYAEQTGMHKAAEQITEMRHAKSSWVWAEEVTIEGVREKLRDFVTQRDWSKYHTPRNVLLAMMGEVGELCEGLRDLGRVPWCWRGQDRDSVSQELADVCIYLIRFSDLCDMDLGGAAEDQLCSTRVCVRDRQCGLLSVWRVVDLPVAIGAASLFLGVWAGLAYTALKRTRS